MKLAVIKSSDNFTSMSGISVWTCEIDTNEIGKELFGGEWQSEWVTEDEREYQRDTVAEAVEKVGVGNHFNFASSIILAPLPED